MDEPQSFFALDGSLSLQLHKSRFTMLVRFVQQPDGKHESGGWQNRRRKWNDHINVRERRIILDLDDQDFVKRNIEGRKGGGFQSNISNVFIATHAIFTGIPAAPVKRKRK